MVSSFDFNHMVMRPDLAAQPPMSPPQPHSHNMQQETTPIPTPHHSNNVTIYQTTGPDAHTGPVMAPGSAGTPLLNPRSCVTCRRRKVRCDKQMPCSNCRRALIPCVFPAPGRAPRQHRPKDPNAPSKTTSQREVELVKRLKKLEGIVEELSGQIEIDPSGKVASTTGSPDPPHTNGDSPSHPRTNNGILNAFTICNAEDHDNGSDCSDIKRKDVQKQFGRLVLDDNKGTARYVSSGFWTKLNDELDAIREETQRLTDEDEEISDYEETPPTESPATATNSSYDHNSFIYGYRSVDLNLQKYHPLASHATFLWSVYRENVDPLIKILHQPTVEALLREARKNPEKLTPSNEALAFAIYYAAVIALEPDEVQTNFGTSRDEVLAQYRFALEQSLARANFLNASDLTVLQAFTIFLLVVRRQDESRFCWSLTGLLIRLAQGMGLHRDGIAFKLSPYETEMRRRLWWAILSLDLRSTEEMGSDLVIGERAYDTLMPTNINDADISPSSSVFPEAREGRTDCAVSLVRVEICELSRRLLATSSTITTTAPTRLDRNSIAEKEQMLIEVYQRIETKFLKHVVDEVDPLYWVAAIIARIIMAKMCMVIYQPMLFPGSELELSEEIRQRVYVAAIEIIEYTHKLNTDPRCKQYRWLFMTYTNWHAVAYALIESCRRPWTALVERGWEAIVGFEKDLSFSRRADHADALLPLRRLFFRAKRHRELELGRLRADTDEARRLDFAERMNPAQARFGTVPGSENQMEQIRERWRALVRQGSDSPPPPFIAPSHTPISPMAPQEVLPPPPPGSVYHQPMVHTPTIEGPQGPMAIADPQLEYMEEFMQRPISIAELWSSVNLAPGGAKGPDMQPNPMHPPPPPPPPNQVHDHEHQMRQQAMMLQAQPPKDEQVHPYMWTDSFPNMNKQFEEKPAEDLDMLGDDFNWHDWSQSIRGLEVESTQPRRNW